MPWMPRNGPSPKSVFFVQGMDWPELRIRFDRSGRGVGSCGFMGLAALALAPSAAAPDRDAFVLHQPTIPVETALEHATPDILPGLRLAISEYERAGGKYVLGPNDCSTFVCDYFEGLGVKPRWRMGTRDMVSRTYTRRAGLEWADNAQNGVAFAYRYSSPEGKEEGHCGIMLVLGGREFMMHNSGSAGGLVVESRDAFLKRQAELGVDLKGIRYLTLP